MDEIDSNKENVKEKEKASSTKILMNDGHRFNKKVESKRHTLYWCVNHRNKNSDCTAFLKRKIIGDDVVGGEHCIRCGNGNSLAGITNVPHKKKTLDFTAIMHERTEDLALSNFSLQPKEIWIKVSQEMNDKSKTWIGLSDLQVKKHVKYVRIKANGDDIFRTLERPPLSMVKASSFFFLQFNLSITDAESGKLDRIVGFGNPALFGLLSGKVQIYIDGTFRIVPTPFYQCLIIMVFDTQTKSYVPVIYMLMTGKSENLYLHALHWIIVKSGWSIEPFSVTCDFEKALHNAVRRQFKGSILNGSLFHWKQAIRRKMLYLKMDEKQVSMAMHKNVIDVLTIIPHDEILTKGIPYVRSIIDKECNSDIDLKKWDDFWRDYFIKFWMSSEDFVKTWNIYDEDHDYKDLQIRTSNGLERYNRSINEKFPTPHPSLFQFVTTIEEEGRYQVQRLEDIRYEKVKRLKLQGLSIEQIPLTYLNFKP